MPEMSPESYTPENPTQGYSQEQQNLEQPASIEALPPQDYVDTAAEGNKEETIGETIRGASGWGNMATLGNLNLANSLVAQAPDLNPEAQASVFSEATTQGQPEGGEAVTEAPNVIEEATNNEVATETSETEATVTDQVSPGLSKEQLEHAEIRERKLNPVEEVNLEVAMALTAKYPNALEKFVDKNGNHYIAIKTPPEMTEDYITIFCKRGVVTIKNTPLIKADPSASLTYKDRKNCYVIGRISTFMKKGQVDFSCMIDQTNDNPKKWIGLNELSFTDQEGFPINVYNEPLDFEMTDFAELRPDVMLMLRKQMQSSEKFQKSKKVENILAKL